MHHCTLIIDSCIRVESLRIMIGRECHIERWIHSVIDSLDEDVFKRSSVEPVIGCHYDHSFGIDQDHITVTQIEIAISPTTQGSLPPLLFAPDRVNPVNKHSLS